MPPEYFSPTYLDEALELMASRSLDLVAGGTDFFPSRGRTPITRDILDVTRLEGFRGIQIRNKGLMRIGAATTWRYCKSEITTGFYRITAGCT